MIFYFFFIVVIYFFSGLNKVRILKEFQITGVGFVFILIFLVSAFRFDVGYDYTMYYHLIEGDIKFIDNQLNRLEPLSRGLITFSHEIGFIQFFFIFSSVIIVGLFYKTIKRSSADIRLSTLMFITIPIFYFQSFSIVRQYMAIAIIFYSYKFIKERRFFFFLLLVSVASLFHKSAFIALPIYFFYGNYFVNKKLIVIIYFLGFFSSNILEFFIRYFSDRYSIYLGEIGGEGGSLKLIFFQLIGLVLLPIIYAVNDKEDRDFSFYLLCFYFGLLIWSSLEKFGHAGIRGALYFMSFTILLIPHLKFKVKEYNIVRKFMFLTCFLFFFFNLYVGSKHKIKDPNMPYQIFYNKSTKDLKPNE